jgi:hypothetical protein
LHGAKVCAIFWLAGIWIADLSTNIADWRKLINLAGNKLPFVQIALGGIN